MKKEIANLVLTALVNNPTMIERASIFQERFGHINLDEVGTPIIKRVLMDVNGIQKFLEETFPGIIFSRIELVEREQLNEPNISFREEHPVYYTRGQYDSWNREAYSLEETEEFKYSHRADHNYLTMSFKQLGIPEELYQVEWL